MSVAANSAHAGGNTQDEVQKYHAFINLAIFLAAITGIEIVIIYIEPFPWPLIVTSLLVLSLIKFICVITWFMHLIYDKLFNSILFAIGLLLGGGTAAALMVLHTPNMAYSLDEMEELKLNYPMPIIIRPAADSPAVATP